MNKEILKVPQSGNKINRKNKMPARDCSGGEAVAKWRWLSQSKPPKRSNEATAEPQKARSQKSRTKNRFLASPKMTKGTLHSLGMEKKSVHSFCITKKSFRLVEMTVFFLLVLFLGSFPVFGEEIQFKADSMTGVSGSKTDETKLSGNAFVKTSTMEIKADSITLDGDDFRYITAEGSVEGKNTETKMDFTCGRLRYDRQTKLARLEDTVHMIDIENEVTTDAQIIEYNQNKEIATMQIGVTLKQKNNTCTAAFAIYRKGAQMLEMSGNPKIVQGDDTFRAQEIILNLDSQEITLSGRVSGTVTDSKKEEKGNKEEGTSDNGEAKPTPESENASEEKPELPSVTDILNSSTEEQTEENEAKND